MKDRGAAAKNKTRLLWDFQKGNMEVGLDDASPALLQKVLQSIQIGKETERKNVIYIESVNNNEYWSYDLTNMIIVHCS